MEIDKAIGIDLGTTNSCVGIMDETDSEILLAADRLGVSTTPSCAWYDGKRNQVVIGRAAYARRGSAHPPAVSIKRRMGTMLLTPLGRAERLPENLPPPLARALGETRAQRLERHLARIEDPDPQQRAAKLAAARAEPPGLWVFDQPARLAAYLQGIRDAGEREALRADPPLLWLPEEISALILSEQRRLIAETLARRGGGDYLVERAVITVPAYFGARQIEATREAGGLAGLRVLELLQEPTAAARYYCWKHDIQDGLFLVFDLGGGTFDVSIVRRTSGVFDTLAVSGNNLLGGDDLDARFAEWIRRRVAEESPEYDLDLDADSSSDAALRSRFVYLAEGVKKALTASDSTILRDTTTIKDRRGEPVAIEMGIDRGQFESVAADVIALCLPKCWEALAKAQLKAHVSLRDVDHIFLVGGSTHLPCVERMVQQAFCACPEARSLSDGETSALLAEIQGDDERQTGELRRLAREMMSARERARCSRPLRDNPDLCVALGAAISAAAHGVPIQGSRGGAVIEFTGPRGTRDLEITVKGRVAGGDERQLAAAAVRLTSDPPRFDAQLPLSAEGTFLFQRVPLEPRTHNRFQLTVQSPAGEVWGQAPLVIDQNPQYAEVASGLDSCSTVSKAIYIDVVVRGKVCKLPLVESGAALTGGLERRRRLKTPDPNTGMLRFRLYQGRRPLADIVDTVDPSVFPGTPVLFTLAISEDQLMRAHYTLGDEAAVRSFVIEPPPPELPPTDRQLREKLQQIEDALSYRPPVQAQTFRIRAARIHRSLEQAQTSGDDPQRIDAYQELDDLLREIGQASSPLTPPWQEYESLLQSCRRLVDAIEKQKPDYPVAHARKTLETEANDARAAYAAEDQQLYGERWERLRELQSGLQRELSAEPAMLRSSPAEQARRRIEELLELAGNLERAAVQFAAQFDRRSERPPAGEKPEASRGHAEQCRQCAQQIAGCPPALQKLRAQCVSSPEQAIAECHAHESLLERWRIVLLAKQEILTGKKVANLESIPEADEPLGPGSGGLLHPSPQ